MLRVPLAASAVVFAALGLLTNFVNVDALLRPLGGRAATHPITAVCMMGIGLGVLRMNRFERSPLARFALAWAIVTVCVARLAEEALGFQSIAEAITPDWEVIHGRFSVESALALGSFAIAAIFRQSRFRAGLFFLVVGLATVFNAVLELAYGLTFFNGNVGPFTLFGLVSIAGAMVTVYIHRPFVRVSFLKGEIGAQTRIMATTAVGIPALCGWAFYRFSEAGASGDPIVAVMLSLVIWAMLVILMATSAAHEKSDAARRRAEREIALISRVDPLTGALNRFGMGEALERAWSAFLGGEADIGLILVDLDHFKSINDTFGHDAGDDVLARVSTALRPYLRARDALGRWGGEEFLILLEIQNRRDLEVVAERVRRALDGLHSPYLVGNDGPMRKVSASLGVSDFRVEDSSASDAISRADQGLYTAKEQGRNRVIPNYLSRAA